MTIVTRVSAKQYFETGDKPTQAQFGDFIDSALFYEDTSDFGRSLVSASAAASARTLLGAGTVGSQLFTATTTASAQNQLGIGGINSPGTLGNIILADNTTASAQNHLGVGAVGKILFEASTTASATNQLGLPLSGTIIQITNTQTGAVATGTTTIPFDDTIPQNTEGDQYMTLAITPSNSNNKLLIQVVINLSNSASPNYQLVAALFQDSTAGALAAVGTQAIVATGIQQLSFLYYMTAGTTSPTTFKVRAGASTAGTTTFNGQSGGRQLGGVISSSITITEIKV